MLQSFLQAWTMGVLFFISAFLAAKSLVKRSSLNFIKERLFRLALPLLLYVFIISPTLLYVVLGYRSDHSFSANYLRYITGFHWLGATGPLWFVQILLLFCIMYVILKKCFSKGIKIQSVGQKEIVSAIMITTLMAFFIRLMFPVGTSYLNLQFCYFASYIVMFTAGILVGENGLLEKIADEKNITWLKISLFAGIPLWLMIIFFGGALEGHKYMDGGFNWQSFTFAFWESLTAIGFSVGLIALFKKSVNADSKFAALMRDNAFGIYFFHAPILVSISLALKHLIFNPMLKFAVVFVIASIVCLVFTFLARKIKPIGIVLK
jgi:hypothetical protein